MTPKEVLALGQAKDTKLVDLKFCDIQGTWHHFTIPVAELTEQVFTEGLGFDASSIRGWAHIEHSDMLVMPDAATAFIDPFTKASTLSLICNIVNPDDGVLYDRSPRTIAKRAMAYLKDHSVADTAYFGPEAEFFIFDDVRYESGNNFSYYSIDSAEGAWNTGRDEMPNLGYKIRAKEGYLPVPPSDKLQDLRNEMVLVMGELGLTVERHHHEVASAGQTEIDLRFDTLLTMADHMCLYKYIVRNVAARHNKTATFMPKPIFGDNGSGMHVHSSLWKQGAPLFAGNLYAGLSQEALWYIGGLLKHANALCAICNPTNNSYKRLVPGYEAPVNLTYSASNRSAVCRIPAYSNNPKAKRVEFRCPDPLANPYLALSAVLMAGLDGIENKIDPGVAMDCNLYELKGSSAHKVKTVPSSLRRAVEALKHDHAFLLKAGVFSSDFLEVFMELKLKEYDQVRLRPHPHEFFMYFDA